MSPFLQVVACHQSRQHGTLFTQQPSSSYWHRQACPLYQSLVTRAHPSIMGDKVEIRIKSPTYRLDADLTLFHSQHDTIHQLKGGIQLALNNTALTPEAQKLIFAGHVLQDSKTLLELNLTSGSSATFHLVTSAHIQPMASQPDIAGPANQTPQQTSTELPNAAPKLDAPGPADSMPVPEPETGASSRPMSGASSTSSDLPQHLQSILRSQSCVKTGLQYQVYMIDGMPYLIQQPANGTADTTAARTSTFRRRTHRATTTLLNTMMQQAQGSAPATTTGPTTVRHQAVDLPAASAFPVALADGRRAVILSPEAVQAMTQQGVAVQNQGPAGQIIPGPAAAGPANRIAAGAAARNFVNRPEVRAFWRTGIPHIWLFLKLAFLVMMLGSSASWKKLIMLNAIAFAIFMWQSGLAAALLRGHAQAIGRPVGRPVPRGAPQAMGPGTPEVRPAGQDGGAGPGPARRQGNALQNLAHAFVSSIVPSTRQPGQDGLPNAQANANANAARPVETGDDTLNDFLYCILRSDSAPFAFPRKLISLPLPSSFRC
jgi:hypothetical protein